MYRPSSYPGESPNKPRLAANGLQRLYDWRPARSLTTAQPSRERPIRQQQDELRTGTHLSTVHESLICEPRFSDSNSRAMFVGMSGDPELQKLRWSIRRLIELIDEGIDSAGEQLSRGESLRAWRAPVGTTGRDDPEPEDDLGMSP